MRRVDASVRALIGTPAVLSRLPLTPASFRLSGLRRTRQHRSDQTITADVIFKTRAFPLFRTQKPLSTRRLTAPPSAFASSPQNAWIIFLLYVAFSKYGKIKLGRADEKPEFNNILVVLHALLVCIAVGVYTLGVAEPMSYYRGSYSPGRGDTPTDDERAQQALLQTFYHWGLHAWAPYITVALGLGIVCYRWNMPSP